MARGKKSLTEDQVIAMIGDSAIADAENSASQFSIDASGPSGIGDMSDDAWVRAQGWTPLEFLTHTYKNPFQKMGDRIAAAKAALDYTHRKLPTRVEAQIEGAVGVRSLDAAALAKLSDSELEVLSKILEKVGV